jgi:hypothetical protein
MTGQLWLDIRRRIIEIYKLLLKVKGMYPLALILF